MLPLPKPSELISRKQYSRTIDLEKGKPTEEQFAKLLKLQKSRDKHGPDFDFLEVEYKKDLAGVVNRQLFCTGCKRYCDRIVYGKIRLKSKGVEFFLQSNGYIFVIFKAKDVFNADVGPVWTRYTPDGNELYFHIDPNLAMGPFYVNDKKDVLKAMKILGLK